MLSVDYGHHHHRHKRAEVTSYVVVEIPRVVVWVDGKGNTVSIETIGPIVTRTQVTRPTGLAPDIPKPIAQDEAFVGVELDNKAPEKPQHTSPTDQDTTTVTLPADPVTTTLTLVSASRPTQKTPSQTALPPRPPPSVAGPINQEKSNNGDGIGICYAPYNADGTCKTQDQVNSDFSRLPDYTLIRSYGVDCDQIKHMVHAAKLHNKKLFVGVFDLQNLGPELDILIRSARDSWDLIATVSIGNELVNSGKSSVQDVVNAVHSARKTLREAGYSGPVVTVDTFVAIIAHPELCHASDFCAANCHAFFDPNTPASEAGAFVKKQAERVSKAGGKRTVITESGWPHDGSTNGQATPSNQNQEIAVKSIRAAFEGTDGELYLFSAFDDVWKKDSPATFGTERYWGIQ